MGRKNLDPEALAHVVGHAQLHGQVPAGRAQRDRDPARKRHLASVGGSPDERQGAMRAGKLDRLVRRPGKWRVPVALEADGGHVGGTFAGLAAERDLALGGDEQGLGFAGIRRPGEKADPKGANRYDDDRAHGGSSSSPRPAGARK